MHSGATLERLLCHPRLPLIAGWDADRPAIRIWEYAVGQLREIGCVGADSVVYNPSGDDRWQRTPSAAWHPVEPQLVVADGNTTVGWTPSGITTIDRVPPTEYSREVAFSPDGRRLW